MDKVNFTKTIIERLEPRSKRYSLGDTKTPSLNVIVNPSGIKTFQVYKKLNGKPRRITLGRYPDLSVENARKAAVKAITDLIFNKVDPNEQKKLEKAKRITLSEVLEDYLKASNLRPDTITTYKRAVNEDFKKQKDKPLGSITGIDIQKRHREISKYSKSRANKTMRAIRALFNFARDQYEDSNGRSLFPDNPVRKMKRQWNKETRRKNYISEHQLPDWFSAVKNLPETQQRGDGELARDYLTFLILTGLRRKEATSLQWSDIDLQARRFIVRHTKNHDELWMPLTLYLANMLKERKKNTKAVVPFPLNDPRRFIANVEKSSGIKFCCHDLRRTFMTIADSLDIGAYTLKALVNHRTGTKDVTEGYVQMGTERLRAPLEKIEDYILSAGEIRNSASIVKLNIRK